MNDYRSQFNLNVKKSYHDSDPFFPTSDRGEPVSILGQHIWYL